VIQTKLNELINSSNNLALMEINDLDKKSILNLH
jgi:hypothetical protein